MIYKTFTRKLKIEQQGTTKKQSWTKVV